MRTDSAILHEDSVCRIEKSTDAPGLTLSGNFEGADGRSILERELEIALREGSDLHLDLSYIEFIDIGCMEKLFDATDNLQRDGCRLVLLGPTMTVRLIIAICRERLPGNIEVFPCPT
jgi:anti-anti-sigma regulatory factor